jgi:hypothetical protein
MTQQYWLADSEARVLGPISLQVVRELAMRGQLPDVRAVSKDGRQFLPLREVPEVQSALGPAQGDEIARAQYDTTRQIRDWLDSVKDRPTEDILRIPLGSTRETARAAFFALVHRYLPSRLPAEATPELRLACEDAFLFLAERIVDLEKKSRTAPPSIQPLKARASEPAVVTWRGGMLHVKLTLARGDARPFTSDETAHWKNDGVFIASQERVMVGTPTEVTLSFESHVTQIRATGRVIGVAPNAGFSVKMLDLGEQQRSMIRTWVTKTQG